MFALRVSITKYTWRRSAYFSPAIKAVDFVMFILVLWTMQSLIPGWVFFWSTFLLPVDYGNQRNNKGIHVRWFSYAAENEKKREILYKTVWYAVFSAPSRKSDGLCTMVKVSTINVTLNRVVDMITLFISIRVLCCVFWKTFASPLCLFIPYYKYV